MLENDELIDEKKFQGFKTMNRFGLSQKIEKKKEHWNVERARKRKMKFLKKSGKFQDSEKLKHLALDVDLIQKTDGILLTEDGQDMVIEGIFPRSLTQES